MLHALYILQDEFGPKVDYILVGKIVILLRKRPVIIWKTKRTLGITDRSENIKNFIICKLELLTLDSFRLIYDK